MKLMKNITKSVVLTWLFCYFFGVLVAYAWFMIVGWPVGISDMFTLLIFAVATLIICGIVSVLLFLLFGILLRIYVHITKDKVWHRQHS